MSRWTMPDSWAASSAEAIAREHAQGLAARQRPLHDHVGERRAVDEAHRDEHEPVGLAGLVDGDDVRVVERGGVAALEAEALAEALVADERRGEHLQRHAAVQRELASRGRRRPSRRPRRSPRCGSPPASRPPGACSAGPEVADAAAARWLVAAAADCSAVAAADCWAAADCRPAEVDSRAWASASAWASAWASPARGRSPIARSGACSIDFGADVTCSRTAAGAAGAAGSRARGRTRAGTAPARGALPREAGWRAVERHRRTRGARRSCSACSAARAPVSRAGCESARSACAIAAP